MNDLKEIGGFIVSADPYVNHDTSLSGNGTLTSPLGVVPGYNETVLWEGSQLISATNLTGTLSEAPSGFDRIGVYWRQSYSNIMGFLAVPTATPVAGQWYVAIPMSQWGIGGSNDGNLYCDRGNVSIPVSGGSLTWSAYGPYERVQITTASTPTLQKVASRGPTMAKIVGINRKQ